MAKSIATGKPQRAEGRKPKAENKEHTASLLPSAYCRLPTAFRGFTLLEVTIATGLLVVIALGTAQLFVIALHQNIAQYLHSGSAPCVQAAKGERLMGIGFDMRGATEKTKGAPIDLIVPKEGLGWEMEATAIMKGTKNLEAAKKVADWATTLKANELYGKYYAIVADPQVKSMPQNYPADGEKLMAKMDVEWMAKNRDRILAEWSKRYDGKSAPKAK